LATLREKKGVSAREMSLALGQGEGYINNIENGNNYPAMATFFYICDYLGVTPKDFFDLDAHDPNKIEKICEKMKGLTDDQLRLIESMIENFKK
jgi:transcriptional regulator with XRE-family HTH domain